LWAHRGAAHTHTYTRTHAHTTSEYLHHPRSRFIITTVQGPENSPTNSFKRPPTFIGRDLICGGCGEGLLPHKSFSILFIVVEAVLIFGFSPHRLASDFVSLTWIFCSIMSHGLIIEIGSGSESPGKSVQPAPLDLDALIRELLSVASKPLGTEVNLPEELLIRIVRTVRATFLRQPVLLELDAPINICGDTHGQFADLLSIFQLAGYPGSQSNYLFLGDFVDRAKQSIETVTLCMLYKIKYPNNFFMLRGNHECASLNRIYGFYDECKRRYSVKLWRVFTDCFNCMPLCAVVADKILCMHGGISPELEDLGELFDVVRPTDVPDEGVVCDLLWADPDPQGRGWGYNARYYTSICSRSCYLVLILMCI
jgi:serine/threonine-protein phosphatase PP1 catalytic subunit